MVMLAIMQMVKGVCVVKRVGSVSKVLRDSVAARILAVCICASALRVEFAEGGGGGAHWEADSMGL